MRRLFVALVVLGMVGGVSRSLAKPMSLDLVERKLVSIEGLIAQYLSAIRPPTQKLSARELSKRLIDGMVLYRMKDYSKAAIVFTDIVKNYVGTAQASTAHFFLADSMFQQREFLVAEGFYRRVVRAGGAHQYYQYALQRLLELEMRRHTFFGRRGKTDPANLKRVESWLARIRAIPVHRRLPSVEYIQAKYLYFRRRYNQALSIFARLRPSHPYYLQAVYFIGVCQIQMSRLNAAAATYKKLIDRVLFGYFRPQNQEQRHLLQLVVMAAARLNYFRGRPDAVLQAIIYYSAIPSKSPFFSDALYERAWAYLKVKNPKKAIQSLELLRAADRNYERADEARVLLGNLKIQTKDFGRAKRIFRQASREMMPVVRKLRGLASLNLDPKVFFDQLTAKELDRFDMRVRLPKLALRWLRQQPEVKRSLVLLTDVRSISKMVADSTRIIRQIERQLQQGSQISAFPALAIARARAADLETHVLALRAVVNGYLQRLMAPRATAEERKVLRRLQRQRRLLEQKLRALPKSGDAYQKRVSKTKALFDRVAGDTLALSIQVRELERVLNAIVSYYRRSKATQRLSRRVLDENVRILRGHIVSLRRMVRTLRDEVRDSRNVVGIDDAVMRYERHLRTAYKKALGEERRLAGMLSTRLGSGARSRKTRLDGLLGRLDRAQRNLDAVNRRIDKFIAAKRARVVRVLTEEKANLARYRARLARRRPESRRVIGGVTYRNFKHVSRKVYNILIKADIGVLDVVWAIKNLAKGAFEKREGAFLKAMELLKAKYREARTAGASE